MVSDKGHDLNGTKNQRAYTVKNKSRSIVDGSLGLSSAKNRSVPNFKRESHSMNSVVTISAVFFGFSTFLTALPAVAWGDLGHEIVGGVAEQMIEPQTKDFVRGIMGIEPLAVSAIFPDHVRDDDRFGHKDSNPSARAQDNHDFGGYHFCEIPTGSTYDTKPNKDVKDCYGAIQGSIKVLKDAVSPIEEKQLALRYLVHVMGDIAQPLHVGNGYDLGGNACQVNVQESTGRTLFHTNLHSFWDETIVTYLGTTYADPSSKTPGAKYLNQYIAAFQKKRPEMLTPQAKLQFGQGAVKDWLQDSQTIRESGLYPDDGAVMSGVVKGEEYKSRPYCNWFSDQNSNVLGAGSQIDRSKIPTIDEVYEAKWVHVAESQLIKGGLRLAYVLDDIAQSSASRARLSTSQQEAILSDLQNKFRGAP